MGIKYVGQLPPEREIVSSGGALNALVSGEYRCPVCAGPDLLNQSYFCIGCHLHVGGVGGFLVAWDGERPTRDGVLQYLEYKRGSKDEH